MRISKLKIKGYKSFRPEAVVIPLQDKLAE